MRNLILVVHISLDGFVAGLKGEFDNFPADDENLAFVNTITEDADAALFGRISYELLNSYWPNAKNLHGATKAEVAYSGWYNSAQKIVFSKTLGGADTNHTIILHDNMEKEVSEIKKQQGGNILIFGSPTVSHQLMQHNLIDSYWVFVNPVIFGEGIPLFRGSTKTSKLKLLNTKQFSNGEIALNYVADRG